MQIGEVVILKLVNGLDVIGRIMAKSNDSLKISNPFIFQDIIMSSGSIAQTLVVYNKFSKDNFLTLFQSHIISIQTPYDSVAKYYDSYLNYIVATNYIKESVDYESNEASDEYDKLTKKHLANLEKEKFIIDKYTEGVETGSFEDLALYNMESPSKLSN